MILKSPTVPFSTVGVARSTSTSDLGFSRWETLELCKRDRFFDIFAARPRGFDVPGAFLLKALKPVLCGTVLGAALIEREIFLGSLLCARISPLVDRVRPARLSPTQVRRGCVVFPRLSGQTISRRLAQGQTFSPSTVSSIERQMRTAILALNRRGWSIGDLTPDRVFLTDAPTPTEEPIATLVDFSTARRFNAPSLLADATLDDEPTFDPLFELPLDVFFDPNASAEKDATAVRDLARSLRASLSPAAALLRAA